MTEQIRLFQHERTLDRCPACLSPAIAPHLVSVDYHYGIEGNFGTSRCSACGSVFMNPMPSVADLGVLYPDDYYSYQPPQPEGRVRRFLRYALRYPRVTHVPSFPRPGVMLDVGCGAGHYLLEMRGKGWTVYGAELSRAAAEAGRSVGLDIRGGELSQAGFAPASFDFVRSNHSFEHIPNPDEVLAEMRSLLKDDGKLFVGIPNIGGLWARTFGKYWWNFGLPVHTINYTEKGITTMLERNGFRVERILHNSDYSGFMGSWQIKANAQAGIRAPTGRIFSNKVLRLPMHYVSKLLDQFRQGDCIEVIASKASG